MHSVGLENCMCGRSSLPRHSGSYAQSSEDLSPVLKGGYCYTESSPWLAIVSHIAIIIMKRTTTS